MNNEKIWQGSTYETTITDKDLTAQTVTLTLKNLETEALVQVIDVPYTTVNDLRTATITTNQTDVPGDYSILYTVTYGDGSIQKFPAPKGDCEGGECDLPILTICEASDEVTS